MINAAGILIREPTGKVLFVKRSGDGDHAGEWAFPGGKLDDGETAEDAARRETEEELGEFPKDAGTVRHMMRTIDDDVDFTTHHLWVKKSFEPKKLTEHDAFAWMDPAEAKKKLKLHPGAKLALKRLDMNELDVAKSIAAGELPSPQFYVNMWLFAIRITGTGMSYRGAIKEHVWRDKGIYLNEKFLERCQGLAVIWVHPDSATLNAKEFADRIIGTVMYPYIQDEEVWGIAKIYDDDAAREMCETQISTSPGVSWDDPSLNSLKQLTDGTKLMIEGDPTLLDHIAVVKAGVWDKGGPSIGVQNDLLQPVERVDTMPDDMTAADKARKDAEEARERRDADLGTKLDKMLTHMDSLSSRMDAAEEKEKAREDAARKDAESKADAARKDAAARRDAERDEWKKADAEMCSKDDAEEAKDADEYKKKGDPEDVAADKARKDRRGRMDARLDKAKKDSESGEDEEDKKKKEEKEKMEREDAARKDTANGDELVKLRKLIEDQGRSLAAFEALTTPRTDDDTVSMADAQYRVDNLYRAAIGKGAPAPMAGESLGKYERRLHRNLKSFSTRWKSVDIDKITDDAALSTIFEQIRQDADAYSRAPTDLAEGQLREVVNVDRAGRRISTFVGKDTFIKGMSRPPMFVTGIRMKHD